VHLLVNWPNSDKNINLAPKPNVHIFYSYLDSVLFYLIYFYGKIVIHFVYADYPLLNRLFYL
jgi:hypothetical protein